MGWLYIDSNPILVICHLFHSRVEATPFRPRPCHTFNISSGQVSNHRPDTFVWIRNYKTNDSYQFYLLHPQLPKPSPASFSEHQDQISFFQHVAIFFKTGGLNYKVYSLALWVREKGQKQSAVATSSLQTIDLPTTKGVHQWIITKQSSVKFHSEEVQVYQVQLC